MHTGTRKWTGVISLPDLNPVLDIHICSCTALDAALELTEWDQDPSPTPAVIKEQHYLTEPTRTLNTSKSKPPPLALKDMPSFFLPSFLSFDTFFNEPSKTADELNQWSACIFIVLHVKEQLWHFDTNFFCVLREKCLVLSCMLLGKWQNFQFKANDLWKVQTAQI